MDEQEIAAAEADNQAYLAAEAAYVEECKRLFGAGRRGWSVWEQDAATAAFEAGTPAADAAADMDMQRARRRADRNV